MPWPQRLNDDEGHNVPNGSDNGRRPMMITDYAQYLQMKLYGFANFVEQHLVPYEYTSASLVVIEASMWLLLEGYRRLLLYDDD